MAEAIQQHTTSIHLLYQRDGIATKPFLHSEIRSAISSNRLQSSNDLFSLPDEREVEQGPFSALQTGHAHLSSAPALHDYTSEGQQFKKEAI